MPVWLNCFWNMGQIRYIQMQRALQPMITLRNTETLKYWKCLSLIMNKK
ncbi:Uncharacterised protein [Mycobacteroides abscessus subsp. abscessus]|nr:Uncharacterised protein [Mycobacteroides abscessus subsp. abscessus]